MIIRINGKEEIISKEIKTLDEFIFFKKMDPSKIVIEQNGNIVSSDDLSSKEISDGDTIEMISFVGGG